MWTHEIVKRESPRINANRIFLAPSCSAPAYRLRRNRTPSGKMLPEKPACGFFFYLPGIFSLFRYLSSEYMSHPYLHSKIYHFLFNHLSVSKKISILRKTRTRVFPVAIFQTACDSCVGDKPEQSTTAQEKCDSR